MKKVVFLLVFLVTTSGAVAQKMFTSFFAGISNYNGDLSAKANFVVHSHFAWGIGFMGELNDHFLVRAELTNGRISGSDKWGGKNTQRNLSFTSSISEFSIGLEYVPVNLYAYKFSPYGFASVALFSFKPTTVDPAGNFIILPDFSTEGQGFYKGRKPYKLRQFSLPFGGGVQWRLSNNKRIGWIIGVRKTFTDYLDDVSTTYANQEVLRQNRGNGSVAIAWRGDEINGNPYPTEGTVRGNPKNNDWYLFSGISFRIRLHVKGHHKEFAPGKRRGSTACPVIW